MTLSPAAVWKGTREPVREEEGRDDDQQHDEDHLHEQGEGEGVLVRRLLAGSEGGEARRRRSRQSPAIPSAAIGGQSRRRDRRPSGRETATALRMTRPSPSPRALP